MTTLPTPNARLQGSVRRGLFTSPAVKVMLFQASEEKRAPTKAPLRMRAIAIGSGARCARYLRHVDTNWVWLTADNLLTDPWSARLAPYYFLAVIALGVHGAAAIRYLMLNHGRPAASAQRAFYVVVAASAIVSTLIMTGLVRA